MTPKKIRQEDYLNCCTSPKLKKINLVIFLLCIITVVAIYLKDQRQQTETFAHDTLPVRSILTSVLNTSRSTNICMKDYYDKYLLVIVYNHPHFDSVDILTEFYRPVFPNLFFCGPTSNITHPNVTQIDINKGIYGYHCLATAFREKYWYKGYFYINDDVILNYWNLIGEKFDTDSIWQSNNQFGRVSLQEKSPTSWYWWVSPYGFKNVVTATEEIYNLSKRYTLFKKLYDTYLLNGKGVPYANNGRSDIVYIPRKYMLNFQELSNIFYKQKAFLEIVLPTILRYLAPSSEILTLKGFYIPGDVRKNDLRVIDSRYFWSKYLANYRLWFIHPFKLHHNQNKNRDLNLALMREILIERTRKYTTC